MNGENKSGSNGDKSFLQDLIRDMVSEFKDVKKEVRESTKAKNDMTEIMKTRPCFISQADKEIKELSSTSQEAIVEMADAYINRVTKEEERAKKAEENKKNGFLTVIKWLISCLLISFCFNIATLVMLLNYFHKHPEILEVIVRSTLGAN